MEIKNNTDIEKTNMENYKVILVDDEEEVIDAIKSRILWEQLGLQIVGSATNGVKALELVEKLQPDIVITDIKMPYMNGLELSRRLNDEYRNVHIIIFTGFDEFDYAKEAGCIVVLNAAPAIELPEECLSKVDILVVNEVEAEFYCHEKIDSVEKAKTEIKKMAEKYNNNVIFTLGKDGAVAYENGTIEFIPAMKVDAIETTGAGDSYIGAVSHSIIEGKSLIEACKFATKCSAITVCRMGAQPSMPTLEDVE